MDRTNTCVGWIAAQATTGKDISNITVTTLSENGPTKDIVLSDDIWHTSLLRGPWKASFQQIWEMNKHTAYQRSEALGKLYAIPGFSEKAKLFIADLRRFGKDVKAQRRLHETKHEYFLGGNYFSP